MADHTIDFAYDNRSTPGLEPVWCHWLDHLGLISLSHADQDHTAALAATPPTSNTTSEGR